MSTLYSPNEQKSVLSSCLSALGVLLLSATTSWAASQIVVPGLESERIVETRVEGQLLLLRTEEGRLYSIPLESVALQSLPVVEPSTPALLSIPDIVELLRTGVSEETIRAHIAASAPPNIRYELTKADLIELKRAGASEAFMQHLIRLGRYGPMATYVTWRSPEGPRRDEPSHIEVQGYANEDSQSGIPYVPYVYPGCSSCSSYPYYPVRPVHPIYPSHPGGGVGGTSPSDGTQGTRPGYYHSETRSLFRSSAKGPNPRQGNLRPTPLPSGRSSDGTAWLRWKGSSGQQGNRTTTTYGDSRPSKGTSSSRGTASAPSSASGYRGVGSSRPIMGTNSSSGRGQSTSRGRSFGGSRSGSRRSMFGGKKK